MINVFEPSINQNDIDSVLKELTKKNISGTSNIVFKFEQSFKELVGKKYCIGVSNGSVALDLALQSLNLKQDDEVILPSFTIISCLSAVLRTGSKPVFCDVDLNSWNMTYENVLSKYTKKTKAVIMVHTYGLTAEAQEIKKFCNKNGIILIEDSSEAHGQIYNNQNCGSFGDISTFSFYANKHITMGEGGALLTDSSKLDKLFKRMRNLDFNNRKRFYHEEAYWNYRLGGLQAALGLSQINNLENMINMKIKQGRIYSKLLSDYSDHIQIPLSENLGVKNHYWVYGVVFKNNKLRNNVAKALNEKQIETRPFFWPLHKQPIFESKYKENVKLENTEKISQRGLYIPLGSHLTKKTQEFIIENLLTVANLL